MLSSLLVPALFAFVPLAADKDSHSVAFTARATDITPGTTVEFAFVGPNSDRAYEAMFVTDASVSDIAKAFAEAGIPRGQPVSQSACRFWPAGKNITVTPALSEFINDKESKSLPMLYTGGLRDRNGIPAAETNMPSAVFSLYSLDQSLLLFDNASDQSAAYGRFTSAGKAKSGERYTFKVSWDGKSGTESRTLGIESGKLREAIASLKNAQHDLDVTPVFSPALTVAEAKTAATALSVIDSRAVKINGFTEGQFFFQGFLPDGQWRDRTKRLTQPLEVSVTATNVVCTVIDEDWSGEGLDPRLTPHVETLDAAYHKFKGDTCLFFVRADIKLERIFATMKKLPASIRNWYVFVD